MTPTPESRFRGAMLGLAVGDAVGTTLEFRPPGTFTPIDDMIGGGPFNLKAGQWTDDTSMALCLAASLVEKNGLDEGDQMERYVRWWREGYMSPTGRCFDIGNTVRSALARFEQDGNPIAGSTDPQSAGNGSLMRLAPVPLFFSADVESAVEMSGRSSMTTHGAPTAVDACRYFGRLIFGALRGESKEELLSGAHGLELHPAVAVVAFGSYKEKRAPRGGERKPDEVRGTGYVVDALEAALWAFHTTDDFRTGCLAAANLGDDADTTAAIYGQLAGAYYGEEGIPAEWRERVAMRDVIVSLADQLRANRR